jgi:predicted DCC family thiol-disulfide oxidoreductase YuxK
MKLIYFDGVCGLCNGFVDFILKIDRQSLFTFCPLQSEYASKHLSEVQTRNLTSVVYQKEGKTFEKSEAVLEILCDIGGAWKLAKTGFLIPGILRDYGYDLVAINRYKLFGKKQTCRIPSQEEKARFIV